MAKKPVLEEHIREAAYHMWKSAGEPHGQDQDFWLKAESELSKPKTRRKAVESDTHKASSAKASHAGKARVRKTAPKAAKG